MTIGVGFQGGDSWESSAGLRAAGQGDPRQTSQITDGASWVILASDDAVKKQKPRRRPSIVDSEWSALDPSVMGLGPAIARVRRC